MHIAGQEELDVFLEQNPDTAMLEVLMPDMNGIFRCKRIHRSEFSALFSGALNSAATQPLVTSMGEYNDEVDPRLLAGEPDKKLLPIANSLAPVPWLTSPTGQVLASHFEPDGKPAWMDPRNVLAGVVQRFDELGLQPVVATELEFYLLAPGGGTVPRPLLGSIRGTGMEQQGKQYSTAEDMWERDDFLNDVRAACELQGVPITAIHSEFAPGQWEINTRYVDDPLVACDHAMLLKRVVKGVALRHGIAATFMAKPFADSGGNGLHIHTSLHDASGANVFNDTGGQGTPALSSTLHHAVGGMAVTMAEAMAIFAPNANSYRRFLPGSYVPLSPCWGYNHRGVSMRIPVSSDQNRRVEHRVAGADANPYLVTAAVLAGMHYGITHRCEPEPMITEGVDMSGQQASLPIRWEQALDAFARSSVMPGYLGENYCSAFHSMRRAEAEAYHARISNLDYEWYLRAV